MYGLNNIYGLQPRYSIFVSDTFWPMIMGQFGIVGVCSYLLCIYYIFKNIQNEYKVANKYQYIAKFLALFYLIISSTSESAFVNPMAMPLAIIIGISLK